MGNLNQSTEPHVLEAKENLKNAVNALSDSFEKEIGTTSTHLSHSYKVWKNRYEPSKFIYYFPNNLGRKVPKSFPLNGDPLNVCICQRTYDSSFYYITCMCCSVLFHGDCVGISPKEGLEIESYVCESCTKNTR